MSEGYGYTRPKVNDRPAGMYDSVLAQQNRRVVVRFDVKQPGRCITPTPTPPPPKFRVWLNAFIPTSLADTKRMTKGSKAGHIVFPGPPLTGCFETDDRMFDNHIGVSCRLQLVMDLDSATGSAQLTRLGSDKTFEVDCDDGELLCEKTPSPSASAQSSSPDKINGTPVDLDLDFVGFASDPCVAIAPNIRTVGDVGYNLATRQFVWEIDTDFFPAWEAYLQIDGGAPITLFTFLPPPGALPFRLLLPGAFNNHGGVVEF